MNTMESTPGTAAALYERMTRNVTIVRRRLARPLTLSEKILLGHLDDPDAQGLEPGRSELVVRPDRVVFQDVLGQSALLQFMQTGRTAFAVPTSIHCDHLIQARTTGASDLLASLDENREIYDFLRSGAATYGAAFWGPGAGIIHQVVLERYAFPGQLIIGTDSHTPTAGGLGACAVGVGGAEAVEVVSGLPWEVRYPRRIAIYLTGALSGWTAPKDVILFVAGRLSVSGGTHAIIEYIGPGARTLSATGKATITNMGAELGATTSMFPADERMEGYLAATGRGELVPSIQRYRSLLEPDPEVEADPAAHYDRVLELDLSTLEPHVVGPHSPDRARPISRLAEEVSAPDSPLVDAISTALIGSCTNSSYQDLSRAADVARQARARCLRAKASLMVTPGSEQVRATVERDGQLGALEELGAVVLANACGPCIGQWRRADTGGGPSTIVTSYNRNFPGRHDGRPSTMSFIASPEIVTALALAGRLSFNPLTDDLIDEEGRAFRLTPPVPAPEVPELGFVRDAAPSLAHLDGELRIDPGSERLQALEPWPAWDGRDFIDLPVLFRAKGKTTTDQISPAGAWLRYRGHLEKFSDNFLMGGIDAFTGERGLTENVITRAVGPVAEVARDYRSRRLCWVVIGDANYGEGSSREHAALSPRLLGGAAIIARSFARIHEQNLKKQGLLALTFMDPADYELVSRDDRLSLLDLAGLAPGQPVTCRLGRPDGSARTIQLAHSYTESQLAWFRAGSALNAARIRAGA